MALPVGAGLTGELGGISLKPPKARMKGAFPADTKFKGMPKISVIKTNGILVFLNSKISANS